MPIVSDPSNLGQAERTAVGDLDRSATRGTQPYLGAVSITSDTAGGAGLADVPLLTLSFTATEKHLIKHTICGLCYNTAAGGLVTYSLTDAAGTVKGFPGRHDVIVPTATTATSFTFVTYEILVVTARITRKWRFAGATGTPHAFGDAATGRGHIYIAEDMGIIKPQ